MGLFKSIFAKKEPAQPFDLSLLKTDMHSHLIPGIDDGSKTMDETLAMLAKFETLGYSKIITTPHIMAEVYPNTPEVILSGLANVQKAAKEIGLSLQIEAAAEYYFDQSLIEKVQQKNVLSFGNNFVLVEFSFHAQPDNEHRLFFEMQVADFRPILAHFERYPYFHGSTEKAREYKEKGALIQVNLNSLTGHYGPGVKKQAERLIDEELVDFVGSDCHRIQHLMHLEEHLNLPYYHKLGKLQLKNNSL
jgi:tyrosine-protein phosphatase YwqE